MLNEEWRPIPGFPDYMVSNYGRIHSVRLGRVIATGPNTQGYIQVKLRVDPDAEDESELQLRVTRSVALLVAEAFCQRPDRRADHVIILDGDLSNVAAWNLEWRPRGFAWSYFHQLHQPQPDYFHRLPVQNISAGFKYRSVIEAGMAEGLLFADIWRSTYTGAHIYPHGSVFRRLDLVGMN